MLKQLRNLVFLGVMIGVGGCHTLADKSGPAQGAQHAKAGTAQSAAQNPVKTPPVSTTPPVSVPVKVALLVPLSGENGALGQTMVDAANMAVFDTADRNFELLPQDTDGAPDKAHQAAEAAVASGANLILGPLFATSIAGVRSVAKAANVPVLSFSTDATQAGDGVYVTGFLPSGQIERVVQYAHNQGIMHIGAFIPQSPYGDAALAALQASALKANVTILPIKRYPANGDFMPELQSLIQSQILFDAVFLPEGGEKLKAIARALASTITTRHAHLLGTGLWDDPSLGQEPALVGGWYAGTLAQNRLQFEKRFNSLYHYAPQRLATLSYDMTALAIALGKQGHTGTSPYDNAALTKPSGFSGLEGIFRLTDIGLIERSLAILQVAPAGPIVIDAAPAAFAAPGITITN